MGGVTVGVTVHTSPVYVSPPVMAIYLCYDLLCVYLWVSVALLYVWVSYDVLCSLSVCLACFFFMWQRNLVGLFALVVLVAWSVWILHVRAGRRRLLSSLAASSHCCLSLLVLVLVWVFLLVVVVGRCCVL